MFPSLSSKTNACASARQVLFFVFFNNNSTIFAYVRNATINIKWTFFEEILIYLCCVASFQMQQLHTILAWEP